MSSVFHDAVFDPGVFDVTATPVEAFASVQFSQFVLAQIIASDPVAAVAAVGTGAFGGSGATEILSDPVRAAAFVGGQTFLEGAAAALGGNVPGVGIVIDYGGHLFSSADRFVVVRRRFQFKGDGRIVLTMERV